MRSEFNKYGYYVAKKIVGCDFNIDFDLLRGEYAKGTKHYLGLLSSLARQTEVCSMFLEKSVALHLNDLGIHQPLYSAPVLHVMSESLRIENGYHGTAAHQDWPSVQGSLNAVTVWIPFVSTKDNFPIEVIPGSHLRGLLSGEMNGSVLEVEAQDSEFVAVDCEPGDVLFLSSFIVHRTGKGANNIRVAASVRFDDAADPSYQDRDFYCAQKRVVDRSIAWKPTIEEVSAVYVD